MLFFLGGSIALFAQTQKLYINGGQLQLVDSTFVPYYAFNKDSVFKSQNSILEINPGDTIKLSVYNMDTNIHVFAVKGIQYTPDTILPSDSIHVELVISNPGVYIYYDAYNYPNQKYLGLAGMICVTEKSQNKFYWNIKEHNKSWNDTIANQHSNVDWSNYKPDYFTINGNSNPHINNDSSARIVGNVGDTITIFIANTGQSVHSIHLHGYHAEIKYSSKFSEHKGWSKDTYPIYAMETVIFEIIPDKPGEYPVHDHNLVAVTGGNYYPNGMFLTMLIQ